MNFCVVSRGWEEGTKEGQGGGEYVLFPSLAQSSVKMQVSVRQPLNLTTVCCGVLWRGVAWCCGLLFAGVSSSTADRSSWTEQSNFQLFFFHQSLLTP